MPAWCLKLAVKITSLCSEFSYVMFNFNSMLLLIDFNYTFWNIWWHFLCKPRSLVLKTEKNDTSIAQIDQQIRKLQVFKIFLQTIMNFCVWVDVRRFKWGNYTSQSSSVSESVSASEYSADRNVPIGFCVSNYIYQSFRALLPYTYPRWGMQGSKGITPGGNCKKWPLSLCIPLHRC